jgi:hypothetical protein
VIHYWDLADHALAMLFAQEHAKILLFLERSKPTPRKLVVRGLVRAVNERGRVLRALFAEAQAMALHAYIGVDSALDEDLIGRMEVEIASDGAIRIIDAWTETRTQP